MFHCFWYLLKVWNRKKLLQSGQEVQHQHLQSAVIVRSKIRGEDILEQTIDTGYSRFNYFSKIKRCFTLKKSFNKTHLEKLLSLFSVFQQQFHLIHKVGFWNVNLCKTGLKQEQYVAVAVYETNDCSNNEQ